MMIKHRCRSIRACIGLAIVASCMQVRFVRAQEVDPLAPEPASIALASLDQAKRILNEHQPSLQLQVAALTRAQADVERAFGQLLPRLELGAGADYALLRRPVGTNETLAFDTRTFVPNATASLAVTFSLSRLASLRSAQLQRHARELNVSATRHQLIGGLAAAMLGVISAERVAARTRAGFEAAEERTRITTRLHELGSATAITALRISQDLSDAKSELLTAIEALSQARRALGQALGIRESAGVAEALRREALLDQLQRECRPFGERTARLDRRAAAKLLESGEAAITAARLAYLPELRLTTQYTARITPALEANFSGERELVNDWLARANLVWTLYDGGQRSSELTRAQADRQVQQADQQRVIVESEQEYRRARQLVAVTQANQEAARSSVQAAREIDRLSRRALELGTATALEVVDAARRLRALEVTLAIREVEALSAKIRERLAMSNCE